MISKYTCTLLLLTFHLATISQETFKYHRSSLYTVLLRHENKEFSKEIETAFRSSELPDKYDEINLSKRVFNALVPQKEEKTNENAVEDYIDKLLKNNGIGRRLVAKWFNHKKDGTFDCKLLIDKGYYNADAFDVALADRTIRKRSVLADASNELLAHTFVIVHDIQYRDKSKTGGVLSDIAQVAANVADLAGVPVATFATAYSSAASDYLAGFKVTVTSYLYRLHWGTDEENIFYGCYYTDIPDAEKMRLFKKDKVSFSLDYVGKQIVKSGNTSLRGVSRQEEFFKKVCTRAMDKAIAQLQKTYPDFRVKTPLVSTEPLTAKIGVKEDIDEYSRF